MRIAGLPIVLSLALISAVPAQAARRSVKRGPTGHHVVAAKKAAKVTRSSFRPGQRGIDSDRAMEIQQALIKAGYMTGEPTGQWDSASENAMQTLQRDNGWQTKLVPDSRALIKLGLGPKREVATTPAAVADNTVQTSGSK